jgi:hypothetical protein
MICLPKRGWRGQTELMRVVVTLIGSDGTMRRRMVDTAASGETGPWEELLTRALAALPPYRAVPGGTVCHLRVGEQVALVAEHDLSGPLYDLVTAVLAIGEPPHLAGGRPAGQRASRGISRRGDDSSRACHKNRLGAAQWDCDMLSTEPIRTRRSGMLALLDDAVRPARASTAHRVNGCLCD